MLEITNLKNILQKRLLEDFEVGLPYTQEHNPENYLSQLLEVQNKVMALIELEGLKQSDIDEVIDTIPDGAAIANTIRQIAWNRRHSPGVQAVHSKLVKYTQFESNSLTTLITDN